MTKKVSNIPPKNAKKPKPPPAPPKKNKKSAPKKTVKKKAVKKKTPKKKTVKKKMGRTVIKINWKQFEKLCALHCTLIEIANFFNCSEDTVERRVKEKYNETFADIFKRKSGKGKISLRRKQFAVANKGNTTMLIWLGKQHLGQADKQEHSGPDGGPISTVSTTITKEMTDKQAADIYSQLIKGGE